MPEGTMEPQNVSLKALGLPKGVGGWGGYWDGKGQEEHLPPQSLTQQSGMTQEV